MKKVLITIMLMSGLWVKAGPPFRFDPMGTLKPNAVSTALKTVAHYKMNDNSDSTLVVDSAVSGVNGTSVRNTSLLATPGKIGGAFLFNGSSDRIDCGRMVQSNATEFSYSAWVYLAGSDPGGAIWNPRGTQLMSGFGLTFGCLTAGSYMFVDGPNTITGRSSPAPARNVWVHVVGVFTGVSGQNITTANFKLYVNGVKVDNGNVGPVGTKAPPLTPNTNTLIGWVTHWAYFGGKMDDVRAYNKALLLPEIAELYNGGNGTEAELTYQR